MVPAFSSQKAAAGFALLLLVVLVLPIVAGKSWLPPRERIYSTAPWGMGAFPYLDHQFYGEKNDIDIAFIGSSVEYFAIDTPALQKKLSEQLGRPAVVRSLCWYWSGFDALYFITEDLLRNRKVHVLVLTNEAGGSGTHPAADRWFRFGDNWEALNGLPLQTKAAFYAEAVLGMPRNLVNLIEPSGPLRPFAGDFNVDRPLSAVNPAERLGSIAAEDMLQIGQPFVDYTPPSKANPSDVCLYSSATKDKFHFLSLPISQLQLHFARKFVELAKKNGTKIVFLNVPFFSDMKSSTIIETEPWSQILGTETTIMGIPPATLFAGISDQDVQKLYFNAYHLNKNGQRYFTSIIAPTLIDLYDAQNKL
jgi:hypothetical protein